MDSKTFPSVQDIIAKDQNDRDKPFFRCEYSHSMDNPLEISMIIGIILKTNHSECLGMHPVLIVSAGSASSGERLTAFGMVFRYPNLRDRFLRLPASNSLFFKNGHLRFFNSWTLSLLILLMCFGKLC